MADIADDHQLQRAADAAKATPMSNTNSGGAGDGTCGGSSRSDQEGSYCLIKSVSHLSDRGFSSRLPDRYVLPASERPGDVSGRVKLPVVDLARLRDPRQRAGMVEALDAACRDYGFFQASTLVHYTQPLHSIFVTCRCMSTISQWRQRIVCTGGEPWRGARGDRRVDGRGAAVLRAPAGGAGRVHVAGRAGASEVRDQL